MTCLGTLGRRWKVASDGSRLLPFVPSVCLVSRCDVFKFLLVALGGRSLGFPVTAIILFSESPLSLCGASCVQYSGFAVGAIVDFWHLLPMVIALNVLPCLALLAENGISVVIRERADAFDCVGLVIFNWEGVRERSVQRRRGERSGGDR